MPSPTDIRKGKVIKYQGMPHLVLEMLHRTQGRQAGFVQTTLRNMDAGSTTTTKFRSTDNVEFMHTDNKRLEYSYVDPEGYHFMDVETFDDTILTVELVEEAKEFMVEGVEYDILFIDDVAMQVQLPASIDMEVVESPEAIRGDTASKVQKPVTTSSGLVVNVPLFIKFGDKIKVNTSDKSYQGRVNS